MSSNISIDSIDNNTNNNNSSKNGLVLNIDQTVSISDETNHDEDTKDITCTQTLDSIKSSAVNTNTIVNVKISSKTS